jgi:hypothetical protein
MTFAVVVVPLPLLPPRVGGALSTRQTIRASQLHRHVSTHVEHPRGPIFFYRWHGTWSG